MTDPCTNVRDINPVRSQQARYVVGQILLDDAGDVWGKDETETGRTDFPSHRVLRVRVQVATRTEHFGSAGADLLVATFTYRNDRRGAVPEQRCTDKGRQRRGCRGERERAQLHRQQHRDVIGRAAQIVVEPAHSGGTGDTAEAEHRHSSYIGAKSQARRDAGFDRRHCETRDGRRHHHVNILRPQPRLFEGGGDCRAAELHRVFDPDVVRLAEVGQRGVLLERQHQVATVDFGTRVELAEQIPVIPERGKLGEHVGDFLLRIVMLWQDALHARYDATGLVGLKCVAALRYSHVTHLSWTTWVAGTVAAAEICDRPRVGPSATTSVVARGSFRPPALSISTTDDFCQ